MARRQMDSSFSSLSSHNSTTSKAGSHCVGRMAKRGSSSDGTKKGSSSSICRQLFRSLDSSAHREQHYGSSNGDNPHGDNNHSLRNVLSVFSPSPAPAPQLDLVAVSFSSGAINYSRDSTPPLSPFGSKTTIVKTPSSVRTAETESIASLSSSSSGTFHTSSTVTTPSISPVPENTRTTTRAFSFSACQCHGPVLQQDCASNGTCPLSPTADSAPYKVSNNPYGQLTTTPPKHYQTKTRKKTKHRAPECPPSQPSYDGSNHSRHSRNSNSSNPSLGFDRSNSHSNHNINNDSVHSAQSGGSYSGSSNRRQKVKTELCMFYLANEACPYGAGCHYAHGEEELQTMCLLDLQDRGLIEDASTYRIKPCFSHVAMGSCPFGKRCACIHDPRVSGTVHSWLPITETQGNNIMTDINVEGLHQKRRFDILYGDPFVGEPRLSALVTINGGGDRNGCHYDWRDLYNTVANIDNQQNTSSARGSSSSSNGSSSGWHGSHNNVGIRRQRRHYQPVWEVHKLSVALQMHGGTYRWMYKYRPSHMIFNELCMVLEKRAFHLDNASGRAIPLPLSKYRSGNPNHCIVREIAFGPDQDPSVRPVALWFNIPDDKVTECTIHKQKLFRWHKNKKSKQTADRPEGRNAFSSSPFDCRDSFVMIRPIDRDAFSLVGSILEHRYATVQAERITSIRERASALEKVQVEQDVLRVQFFNLKNHWNAWAYPRTSGRPPIDEHTPVPPADAEYTPCTDVGEADNNPMAAFGCFNETKEVWDSFLSTLDASKKKSVDVTTDRNSANTAAAGSSHFLGDFRPVDPVDNSPHRKRLSVFVRLSHGETVDGGNRSLPRIQTGRSASVGFSRGSKSDGKPKDSYLRQSERCWRSLLLQNDGPQAEWDIVVDHFTNSSRSQKVLNIVQQ